MFIMNKNDMNTYVGRFLSFFCKQTQIPTMLANVANPV
jgi:hypothetical protein